LRLAFGANSELLLSGDYGRFDGIPLTYAKPIRAKPGFSFDNPTSVWKVRTSHLTSGKNIQQGASAKLAVRLNPTTTLTSLTAYRRSNYRFFIDADATELPVITSDVPDLQHQVSQEVTLVQRTAKLTWIGGAFFFDDRNEGRVEITVYPRGTQTRPFATIRGNAWALFGQGSYRMSSRVSLTAGIRYTDEQKDLHNIGGEYVLGTQSSTIRRRSMTLSTAPATTPGRPGAALKCKRRATRLSTSLLHEASRAADSTSPRKSRGRRSAPSSPGVMKVA
jgi:outer membrane receptor protein involved in Fe transport